MLFGVKLGLTSKWLFVICMIPIFSGRPNESWLIDCIQWCWVMGSMRTNGVLFGRGCMVCVQQPGNTKENLEYTFSFTVTCVVTFSKCSNAVVLLPNHLSQAGVPIFPSPAAGSIDCEWCTAATPSKNHPQLMGVA